VVALPLRAVTIYFIAFPPEADANDARGRLGRGRRTRRRRSGTSILIAGWGAGGVKG